MATLVRRTPNGSTYDVVPGMNQPDVVPLPSSGTFTPRTVGQNQAIFYDPNYRVTSPLVDYQAFEREYSFDSTVFGMLGTGYGAAARRATSPQGFFDMYPSLSPSMRTNIGEFGIGVTIDWDMPNKAAEPGTTAYYRKMADDMKFPEYSPEELEYNQRYDDQYGASDRSRADFYRLAYTKPEDLEFVPAKGGGSYQPKSAKDPTYRAAADFLGWNKANENLTPGWEGVSDKSRAEMGLNNVTRHFSTTSRLAPTSISQGRGIFNSGVSSLNPIDWNSSIMRQLKSQVLSRKW